MEQMPPCPACDVTMFEDAIDRHEHIEKCVRELRDEHLSKTSERINWNQFASAAITGLAATGTRGPVQIVEAAGKIADAMLEEVRKRK